MNKIKKENVGSSRNIDVLKGIAAGKNNLACFAVYKVEGVFQII